MKIVDTGVLSMSFMDFSTPSDFAKKALYYCTQFGHFYCNSEYYIARDSLDLFLLVYVCEGSLYVETRGKKVVASKGQIALLNCRYPHRYYCKDSAEFLWFHFNGNSSDLYVESLFEQFGIVFSGEHVSTLRGCLETILSDAQLVVANEHIISLNINRMLAGLAAPREHAIVANTLLYPAFSYIRDNFDKEVDLDQLATLCNISTSHFIRSFKKYINCTPHEYLLLYRLQRSKHLLRTSPLSIEQIGVQCGFNSASHFVRAFRKINEMTPSEFRKMQFF